MAKRPDTSWSLIAPTLLLALGTGLLGYGLALVVNDLEGGGQIAAMASVVCALSTILFARADRKARG